MSLRSMTALVALMLAACPLLGEEKITLKQKFLPGKYQMKQEVVTQMETTMQTQTMKQSMEMTMTISLVIEKPDAQGIRKLSMSFDQICQKMSMGGQVMMDYDSAKPADENNMMAKIFKPLLSAKISADLTAEGKLQNAKGLEELWDTMAKDNPQLAPVAQQMKKQMGNSMVENLMMQAGKTYPDKPVGVGDTWKSEIKMDAPMVGPIVMSQDSKLAGVETVDGTKVASIDYVTKGKIDKPSETTMGATKVTIKSLDSTQKGTMKVNLETGMASENKADADMEMSMEMTGQNGQNVATTTKQKIKTTLTTTYRP